MHLVFSVFFGLIAEELSYTVFARDWLVRCFPVNFTNFNFIKLERGFKFLDILFMYVFS